ncbi:bifunctional DNA primase/polymerase [Reyranella sp.]|uniref:bifunctional DNA primase/polymerase n=1 Tax=Reyranella sp. TaxID=1929291 RepID=UPI0037836F55
MKANPHSRRLASSPSTSGSTHELCRHPPRNGLTVVDIDSTDDRLVDECLARFGDTPLQVLTPSGGRHLYFRNNGETRRIRPLPDVDVLGAGNVVCAGSVVPKGRYLIERGSLDDINRLPALRAALASPTKVEKVPVGERNETLFRYCQRTVSFCDTLDQLLDAARTWADNQLAAPLPDAEIVKTCNSVWNYRGGRRRVMNHIVESPTWAALVAKPDALALFAYLSAENGPDADFMIADGLGPARGWSHRFVPTARKALLDMGVVRCVRRPGKKAPGLYRWNLDLTNP